MNMDTQDKFFGWNSHFKVDSIQEENEDNKM